MEVNASLLTAEDFAVVIKHLPPREDFKTVKELKVKLWHHLEKVLEKENSVTGQKDTDNSSKIMNIHFGMTDFSKLKILMQVYDLIKQQFRVDILLTKDDKNKTKYEKQQQ